jgi:hypothetical protein
MLSDPYKQHASNGLCDPAPRPAQGRQGRGRRRALALVPSSAVHEALFMVRLFISQGASDDQESDNLFCLDALTPGEVCNNLGYPRGNVWGIAHSQLLRYWSTMYTHTAGPVRTRVPPCHRTQGELGGS